MYCINNVERLNDGINGLGGHTLVICLDCSPKLTCLLFEEHALEFPRDNSFHNQLVVLSDENILPTVVKDTLFLMKNKGNAAVHDSKGSLKEAKKALESAFLIGKWFYSTYSALNSDISKLVYAEPVFVDDKKATRNSEKPDGRPIRNP